MSRPKALIPKLCIDKSRNRAFCKVNGRFVTLGPAGSREAQAAYGRLLTDLAQNGACEVSAGALRRGNPPESRSCATLNEVFLRFATEEFPRYSKDEQFCLKGAIRSAREIFGELPASDFGPLKLRLVRDAMIRKGWSRSFVNKEIKRLRLILRWGVSFELVPQTVVDSLASVKSLAAGESDAPESRPRHAIPDAELQAVRNVLAGLPRDLFDLMLLTGCRPGELVNLKCGEIDRSREVWRAELVRHKTRHQGKSRTLYFNATAQLILRKYLKADPDERLFSTTRDGFGKTVARACEVAFGMPDELRKQPLTAKQRAAAKEWRRQHVFTPHWLRHTVATRLADEVGTEAAQRLLGHATRAMTEHYSRAAERVAVEAAKRLG